MAGLLAVAVILYALFHCIMSPANRVRSLPKGAWIAAIILLPVVGAALWFFLGAPRRAAAGPRPVRRPGNAPDDDADFLRKLDEQRRRQQREEALRAKEAELSQRERELRARETSTDDAADEAPGTTQRGKGETHPETPGEDKRHGGGSAD